MKLKRGDFVFHKILKKYGRIKQHPSKVGKDFTEVKFDEGDLVTICKTVNIEKVKK